MPFFSELRRRNVFKVGATYAVVAWLLIQVADVVFPAATLPDWTITFVALLLVLGFPVAIILAWAYEVTPDGIKKTRRVPMETTIKRGWSQTVSNAVLAIVVIAVGLLVVDRYFLEGTSRTSAGLEGAESISEVASSSAEVDDRGVDLRPNSVAVLPFDNMSADPENAYFAAGIHDEIIGQLAKLRNLDVIARTSVMQYAGAARPITEIARELHVAAIMEGSVSYAEGRVAVRAQLIDSKTGLHLWSDTYNREFKDIFGIQADIAMNVANALATEFSPEEQQAIEKIPTDNPAAYALYLKALALWEVSDAGQTPWNPVLDQAISVDPDFGLAYAAKAYLNAFAPFSAAQNEESIRRDAEQALALDPAIGLAHAALAYVHQSVWQWDAARAEFEMALEYSPNDPIVLMSYGRFQRYLGNYEEAVRLGQRSVDLAPAGFDTAYQLGVSLRYARDFDAALDMFRYAAERDQSVLYPHMQIGFTEISRGNLEEAARELETAEQLMGDNTLDWRLAQLALGYAQLGRSDDVERIVGKLQEMELETPVDDAVWSMALIALGDYEQALGRLEAAIDEQTTNIITLAAIKANAYKDPILETDPRFVAVRGRIGLR